MHAKHKETGMTRQPDNTAMWAVQRQIDGRYFDGEGWTDQRADAYRTDHEEAVNLARHLIGITPGWVRAVLVSG